MKKREILKILEDKLDHYTPYRPISDTSEMIEVRKVLNELLEEVDKLK